MAKRKSVSIARKPSAEPEVVAPASSKAEADGAFVYEVILEPMNRADQRVGVLLNPSHPVAVVESPGPLGRLVYGAVFGVTYGVVFSAILLGKLIPGSGLVKRAMHDGTEAAEQFFEEGPESRAGLNSARLSA